MDLSLNLKEYKIHEISHLKVLGRNVKNAPASSIPLSLFWAGSGIEINVKTSEVWAKIRTDYFTNEVWICVYLNGRKISRFIAEKGESWVCVARSLNPQKENRIEIFRDTQPMSGDGAQICQISAVAISSDGLFCPVADHKFKIEFIGDSITSGEGLVGAPDEWDWIPTWISVENNYAMQVCRTLDAEPRIISQCGWGTVTAWNNNVKNVIPPYYEKVCGLLSGEKQVALGSAEDYDFSSWQPDFIFINLGTNDSGAFDQAPWINSETGIEYKMHRDENGNPCAEDAEKISLGVKNFLLTVRKNNPHAKICWVWGMIDIGSVSKALEKGVEMFKAETSDKNCDTLVLDSMALEIKNEDKGSRGHPGPLTHRNAANKILQWIEKNN